jgi:nitric-oxide synthase
MSMGNEALNEQAQTFFKCMVEHDVPTADRHWCGARIAAVQQEIVDTGTYVHTPAEITFGARLAWYNSNRCIARHLWRTLEVFDARHVTDHAGVVEHLERHMDHAFNQGRIRSAITVFAPRSNGADPVRIGNHQLVRYAGFKGPDDSIIGDPHSLEFTTHCLNRGWEPSQRGRFTPLPWCIWIDGREMPPHDVFQQRPDLLNEVELSHPEAAFFAELGLRWYAVPFLADMALVIGGITYPCAPFNGFYMGTEIGARNLADANRYNMLPAIAEGFSWDLSDERSLWRDRALVELNRAVLHSFDAAGVRMGDHHALAASFSAFCTVEGRKKRSVTGDWTWLVPPMSAALTPLFHRKFDDTVHRHTNFFLQVPPSAAPEPPKPVTSCPYHLRVGV